MPRPKSRRESLEAVLDMARVSEHRPMFEQGPAASEPTEGARPVTAASRARWKRKVARWDAMAPPAPSSDADSSLSKPNALRGFERPPCEWGRRRGCARWRGCT